MAKRELAKTSSAAKAAGKVQAVKEWLDMNYEIKINIFDHSKSYIESKEREYTTSITENDIYMHMIDDGLACSKSLLKAILTSPNQMTRSNSLLNFRCTELTTSEFFSSPLQMVIPVDWS